MAQMEKGGHRGGLISPSLLRPLILNDRQSYRKTVSFFKFLQPYISSNSHHPNPTLTERIYRAFFLHQAFLDGVHEYSLLVEMRRKC